MLSKEPYAITHWTVTTQRWGQGAQQLVFVVCWQTNKPLLRHHEVLPSLPALPYLGHGQGGTTEKQGYNMWTILETKVARAGWGDWGVSSGSSGQDNIKLN